jgi:hypothetical protein
MVEAEIAGRGGSALVASCGKQHVDVILPVDADAEKFRWVSLARFAVNKSGEQSLELKSVGEDWHPLRLRGIRLRAEPTGGFSPR